MSIGPFGMSAVRAEAVDFTDPILIDYARILAGKGNPEVDPWGFLLPLTPVVWLAFFSSLLFLLSSVYLLVFFVWLKDFCQIIQLGDISFAYVRVLLQQDTRIGNVKWWSRLVLGSWMLLTLVLTRSYSSNLMSLLTVRYIPQPFQTLSNLLDSPATTMIWEANTAYVQYYKVIYIVTTQVGSKSMLSYATNLTTRS
ncbi:hypothetical protein Pmani_009007 [Petrolisthes manimaculis]|uniref:Ionotropic glutamate receptor C-terminal domain-containing protein n=1 Tax=Petrolisthes manimaculis TaxID=1843537 RepID=A0AAE1Q564_9EUCA|nr:hypothetical protein Pmani_009007 [Petrolisthes manimaculis]